MEVKINGKSKDIKIKDYFVKNKIAVLEFYEEANNKKDEERVGDLMLKQEQLQKPIIIDLTGLTEEEYNGLSGKSKDKIWFEIEKQMVRKEDFLLNSETQSESSNLTQDKKS